MNIHGLEPVLGFCHAGEDGRPVPPDVQAKLDRMALDIGRSSDELVQDAVVGFLDELALTREMLERRYRELETGRVQPIDGEEAFRRLMAKTEDRRQRPEWAVLRYTRKPMRTSTKSALV